MALSDLKVFQEYAYSAFQELLDYNVNLFNAATRGGLVLTSGAHQGDFSEMAFWKRIPNLVRRRDAYGAGALAAQDLSMNSASSVKVASGTNPVNIPPGMMKWIQRSPEEAGALVGKQMAQDDMADKLATSIKAYVAAVGAQASNKSDGSAATASLTVLNTARALLGDRAGELACWVMHSKVMFDIFGTALANNEKLFVFGNVQVVNDGFGNPFVVTDAVPLLIAGTPNTYNTLGLTPGAVIVEQNNDFTDNVSTLNGTENIARTYQAEWSFQLSLKGFTWDQTNGGKSPSNAALATATNWDKVATSYKDLAGILLVTK